MSPMPALAAAPAAASSSSSAVISAARALLPHLERGQSLDAAALRAAMVSACGGSDAEGAWTWKEAYEAGEAAQVLFLRKFGPTMRTASPHRFLSMLDRVAALLPSQTRRSPESQALQQFSTPIPLGSVVACAAGIGPADLVLEPSAGTGLLAIFAELAGASLLLNERAEIRAAILAELFPRAGLTRFDAARIDDHLDPALRPTVVLMNPPFSAEILVERRRTEAGLRHLTSALARLAPGGRLVAITGAGLSPDSPTWHDGFVRLQTQGRVVFTAALAAGAFARHGTGVETRLTVIDRLPAEDPTVFPPSAGVAEDVATLLDWVLRQVPPRQPLSHPLPISRPTRSIAVQGRTSRPVMSVAAVESSPQAIELAFEPCDWAPETGGRITDALYEPYCLQSIRIPGARPHPTRLVQSAAMASVAPPKPSYRPHQPPALVAAGLLSDAQLESVIAAGEAHADFLAGNWIVDESWDRLTAAPEGAENGVRFRRGWFLGDGTGAGKGRQVAGILLDNWLKGRRKAVWISKSDKLIEDARRDWSALGQERLLITPLARFRQGSPIVLAEGILFTTYATLRSAEREAKAARVRQIVDWLGPDFDGVIVFDEAHAMANAGGGLSERGEVAPSQQGRAGLRLQHALPRARVLYVSATGATTVQNLAYAQRLGLWGGVDFPFATRAEFVQAIEAGGVAAMEVLARDLKALGLYAARSLSYEGVAYDLLEHRLTPEQMRIYDAYAGAFQIIHSNLTAALEASSIAGCGGTLNPAARSAARSAFEASKQRFFNHLITAMKTPTLLAAIERDLAAGHAVLVQIVSTGEALMERRLAEIPAGEWGDLSIDITPREYVLDYLAHSFPTQLYEPYTDGDGTLCSRPVFIDGQPVQCREAVERRDRLIEHLAALAPVPGALDQIVQHFGTARVAEVTGRARRIVRVGDRLTVETRAASANLAEAQAFMDDEKPILVFSEAGGTGRSYHADLGVRNQRLRVHYLLEAGWKADAAIQGLGRSNRTNQAQPPLFRPVATNVKAEKRFLSTIARRLDSLGAITRGQRQTGGQGLFRADDNLESVHARAALRQLYAMLFAGTVAGCSLQQFEDATGLDLTDQDGSLREDLPPITTFLNRLLALPIALQNSLFGMFEDLLTARIEGAIASGSYESGVETLVADSLTITDRRTVYTHPGSGAETRVFTIARRDRNRPIGLDDALERADDPRAQLLVNRQSGRAALQLPAPGLMLETGAIERRVRLLRPMERSTLAVAALEHSHWQPADRDAFAAAWRAELTELPAFTDSRFSIVTGLLLPIWRRLPDESPRVYRLQTDDGERVIGRVVSAAGLADLYRALGTDVGPVLSTDEAWAALLSGDSSLHLADGLALRRATVMGLPRAELCGFTEGMVDRLKAMGLIAEIISWRLRLFIPTGEDGATILAALLLRYPLIRIEARR